jgi:hypothetical protein
LPWQARLATYIPGEAINVNGGFLVRMIRARVLSFFALLGISLAASATTLAQDDQFLMPDQSAAKAKQILKQAIGALGGSAYLNLHDTTCSGSISTFDHSGQLNEFIAVHDTEELPDKDRTEYIRKGRNSILQYVVGIEGLEFAHGGMVITVYNGNHGWSYDRSGVSELPAASVNAFHEQVKRSIDNILRFRLKEPGMIFAYGGEDVVELKKVDWVELTDADNHTIRIAIDRETHLPIRKSVEMRDPKTQLKTEEIEYLSNYHVFDGIETPLQIERERNGFKVFQAFYDKCAYNTNPSDALFTRADLDQRWAQSGKKDAEKETKAKKKDTSSDE